MKRVLTLLIIFLCDICSAENTILAIVDGDLVTSNLVQNEFSLINSSEEKIKIIYEYIDIILQLKKIDQLNLYPTKDEINLALFDIANLNNITINELQAFPEFKFLEKEVIEKISILNLQRLITRDIISPDNEILNTCYREKSVKEIKQIKIAQIIISEIDTQTEDSQNNSIKSFLDKLSVHINKGGSFKAFAKLYSQHPSYVSGGETEWLEVSSPTLLMLDSLKDNEVSRIYMTDFGFAIGIKLEERFFNKNLKKCKEKVIYLNAENFYINWVKDLRKTANIKIYHDKL